MILAQAPLSQGYLDFLLTRRSRPARALTQPAPDRAALQVLLTAAARVPDHGKLEPWRFIVLGPDALRPMAARIEARGLQTGIDPDKARKSAQTMAEAPLVVAVIASPRQSGKIPQIEQTLSAGAVCLSLVNAALASGWGACWLTGWVAHDHAFAADLLDLSAGEWVAGFVHIGTGTDTPPERPRPDLSAITTWRGVA